MSELARLRERDETLTEALRAVEWNGNPDGAACPGCSCDAADGHADDCIVATALAVTEAPNPLADDGARELAVLERLATEAIDEARVLVDRFDDLHGPAFGPMSFVLLTARRLGEAVAVAQRAVELRRARR